MIQSIQFPYGKEFKTTLHYLLCCDIYFIHRLELLNDICALNHSLEIILKILLYGAEEFSFKTNSKIFKCTGECIEKTDRFSCPLFLS